MTQLSRKEIAEIIINRKEWSDQEWTNATGISRQTFWRMRNNKIRGVESKTLELMARASDQRITWKDHTKNQGQIQSRNPEKQGKRMTDIEYTLELYRETISLQREKIKYLENKLKLIVSDYSSGLSALLDKEVIAANKEKEIN
jgi:DNA-binding Xre family transcriptional regulator